MTHADASALLARAVAALEAARIGTDAFVDAIEALWRAEAAAGLPSASTDDPLSDDDEPPYRDDDPLPDDGFADRAAADWLDHRCRSC